MKAVPAIACTCGKAGRMVHRLLNGTFFYSFLAGCGGTLFSDNGILTNPGYPGSYSNNTHCEWTIVAPSGRPVNIRFPFVNINPPGDCAHNYLVLYNGPDDSSPPFGTYCGTVSKTLLDFHM